VNKVVVGFVAVVGLLLFMAAVRHSRLPDIDSSKTVEKALRTGRYKHRLPSHDDSRDYETPAHSFSGKFPKSDRSAADITVENR